ncbi:MAG: AAA family ATPase [Phycisphaerales bacterium]|nr:AAA family ATPase [Phycisphaerales bacterium]
MTSSEKKGARYDPASSSWPVEIATKATPSGEFIEWAGPSDLQILAIVFTDIIDSTSLNNEFGIKPWDEILSIHSERAADLITVCKGFRVKMIGDAVLAVFRSSRNAVAFANQLEADTGHPDVRIRAGVHVGQVRIRADDTFGPSVNFASRVVGRATKGGIWISDGVHEHLLEWDRSGVADWTRHAGLKVKGFNVKRFTLWSLPPSRERTIELSKTVSVAPTTLPAITLAQTEKQTPVFIRWAKSVGYVPLAVVFTDVIGSTKLNIDLGDLVWDQVRTTHFRRAEGLIGSQHGFLVKTIGDAVMALFPNVINATSFAMALEREPGDPRIRIRAGVHVGQMQFTESDVFGNTVNIAARISGMPKNGGIWISDEVMKDMMRYNPTWKTPWTRHENVSFPGFNAVRFKVWSLPPSREPAFEVSETPSAATGMTSTASTPARPPRVSPLKLSHVADELIGRDMELQRLDRAWVATGPGKPRIVFIVGWGGTGKTALIVEWMNRLSADGWRGATHVFNWSFYSQGTRTKGEPSSVSFVSEALKFFGDNETANSNMSGWDKGARIAQLVTQHRTLLILDGLEPLQHPPGPMAGKLKDDAIESLLRALAWDNPGLCVVTTRETVTDLASTPPNIAPVWPLDHLSEDAGAAILKRAGVRGTDYELRRLSRDVRGHALTLHLWGQLLARADVRTRDMVKFDDFDAVEQGRHAFKVLAGYEHWFAQGGEAGRRQLAVLRVMGLFDRPADPGCLAALRDPPIAGLTDALGGLSDEEWNVVLSDLESIGLATVAEWERPRVRGYDEETGRASMIWDRMDRRYDIGEPREFTPPAAAPAGAVAIDVHPLIREYFAARVREANPDAWREGHARLYEHLGASVPYWPEGMDGLQPLYQAVAHGCLAGLHERARADVYRDRILRGTGIGGNYSTKKLGAIGPDLGAVACFFDEPWTRVSEKLTERDRSWLLNEASFSLRALGRLTEAVGPMRAALEMAATATPPDWHNAATRASNLSELQLTLGDVRAAVADGKQSVEHADRSEVEFQRMISRATHADALHHAGRRDDARALLVVAEAMQGKRQPEYPRLYSLGGFMYCDLLLADAERAAWRCVLDLKSEISDFKLANACDDVTNACDDVTGRARLGLGVATRNRWLLDVALDNLTLARAALYRAVLSRGAAEGCESGAGRPSPVDADPNCGADDAAMPTAALTASTYEHMAAAVDGLRRAGTTHHVPRGLLTRAMYHFVHGDAAAAARDLDEAWEIARRGPMRLFMADVQLHRARLFRDRAALDEAARLIDETGYHRRDEELADARAAGGAWPG